MTDSIYSFFSESFEKFKVLKRDLPDPSLLSSGKGRGCTGRGRAHILCAHIGKGIFTSTCKYGHKPLGIGAATFWTVNRWIF